MKGKWFAAASGQYRRNTSIFSWDSISIWRSPDILAFDLVRSDVLVLQEPEVTL